MTEFGNPIWGILLLCLCRERNAQRIYIDRFTIRKMKILAFSKNNAPGVLVFIDKLGEEDSVLVNPGTPVSLSVKNVVRHDPHITYTVIGDESENEGTQVIVRRKKEPSNTPGGAGESS